ncbi:MAG: sigma factor-like helix-turn-helix DNA-binding protein [Candidatus Paceibacterota bacterium]
MELDYKTITQNILKQMPERTKNVLSRRFSLGKKTEGETLEAIGKSYKITRERVRQIEADGLKRAKKIIQTQPIKSKFEVIKSYFEQKIKESGGLKKEATLLSELGSAEEKNYIMFLLALDSDLQKTKEDQSFFAFYSLDKNLAEFAKKEAARFVKKFENGKEPDTLDNLFAEFEKENEEGKKICSSKQAFSGILEISKNIFISLEGDKIGLKSCPEINPRTVKDKVVVILKKNKKPLHFKEITDLIFKLNKQIEEKENRGYKLHPQTVHNELIRNNDFVLVGRGFYALKDWGYYPGRVKDIIQNVLKASECSLSKEEIIDQVKKQRIVKDSTIFLSLQNKNHFEKDGEGKYKIREV